MGPKLALGSGAVLVLGLDPFPKSAPTSIQALDKNTGIDAERSLLNECVREAFWSRVLPLSGLIAVACHKAAKKRLIASHPTFGIPLRFWALNGLASFELGYAMYGDSCANKVVARLPTSILAANIQRCRNQLPALNPQKVGETRLQSQGDADIAPSDGELDWLAVFRSAEEKKTEVENAEQGPSMLTYAELRQQNRELREVVDPTKPLSPYDRLRKQNRKVARSPEGQMCWRDAS